MNSLLRGIGGGFGRVLGRFACYFFIGFIIYIVITKFDIDLSSIIPKINIGGIIWGN